MKQGPVAAANSEAAELMIRLAMSLEKGRTHGAQLEAEAAATQVVTHLSRKASENDVGAMVNFFANALGLAREAMQASQGTSGRRTRPVESSLAAKAECDSSYWFG